MILTDTHTHLYLDAFEADRDLMINRAFNQGIRYMLLPNINSQSIAPLLDLCEKYTENIFPMMGLHPTDVKADYQAALEIV
jgi:TatD DNase family protein